MFHDRRSIEQQCCVLLHSSSLIVGAMHTHYTWSVKSYGLYPSLDALQIPALLEVVVSVCTPLSTWMQQIPTLLGQQCWELLYPFACSFTVSWSQRGKTAYKYLYFYNTRSNQSLGECVRHVLKVIWKLVYWLGCQSVAHHFKPLLCDTRLTWLAYLALFSRYNAPGI